MFEERGFAKPGVKKRQEQQGFVPTTMAPEATQRHVAQEIQKWKQVAERAKVQPLDQ